MIVHWEKDDDLLLYYVQGYLFHLLESSSFKLEKSIILELNITALHNQMICLTFLYLVSDYLEYFYASSGQLRQTLRLRGGAVGVVFS